MASHIGSFTHFSPSDTDPTPDTIVLPPDLVLTLLNAISPEILAAALCMVVADTGATNHMLPDCAAFISYKSVHNLCVWMGNNSYAPVLGQGTAIISLNGKCLLIWNVLHLLALQVPLYSLRAHICNCRCGFLGSFDTGMQVYFWEWFLAWTHKPTVTYPMYLLVSWPCCLPFIMSNHDALLLSTQSRVLPFGLAWALPCFQALSHPLTLC